MLFQDNFSLVMTDASGVVIPELCRSGHNVMTSYGRDLFTQLIGWSSISSPDIAYENRRPRYMGVGDGSQAESKAVTQLVSALEVTSGVYLQEVDTSLTDFPVETSVAVRAVFSPSEITYSASSVTVSEAGLFFDVSPGGVHTVGSPTNVPAFYKKFNPVVKLDSFTMTITWCLRF